MDINIFKNPSKEYRASPFWSWTGKLEPDELVRQVREMKKQGYGGYFMHSREGLETKFLGDEWFEGVKSCLREGKRIGMESWIYDEDRWPSGGAGGYMKEEWQRGRRLECKEIPLDSISAVSGESEVVDIFAIVFKETGVMKSFRRINNAKTILPQEKVYSFSINLCERGNWHNGSFYVDLLNPEVTKEFLKIALDPYVKRYKKDFGEYMPGTFIDEPNYQIQKHQLPWTEKLPIYFKKLNGYDCVSKLPLLFF